MNRKRMMILLTMTLLFLSVAGNGAVCFAENNGKFNRWNIVFVMDESGSMKSTDPNRLRYEAVQLFTAEIANSGNYMGSVSFGTDILNVQEIQEMNGQANKKKYVNVIANQEVSNYTNIGAALSCAVDLLDEGRNENLKSAILFLTDGNTDMAKAEEIQESLDIKAEAMERARQAGYQIYSICLNANGKANLDELEQLATATGGAFTEIKSASDLNEVETMYYQMIFGGGNDEGEFSISQDGTLTTTFEVPYVGVEELNVLVNGNVDSIEFTKPDGMKVDTQTIEEMTVRGTGYLISKIINPEGGIWKATIYGDANAKIHLRWMYNTDFYIRAEISPESGYMLGDQVTFKASVYDKNGKVTDKKSLSDVKGELIVRQGSLESVKNMQIMEDGLTGELILKEEGTCYVSVRVYNDMMSDETEEPFEISVNNETPVPPEEMPKVHTNIWPIIGGKGVLELDGLVRDPESEKLTYSVESTAFHEDDYSLDGSMLTVNNFSISKGSFRIRAQDPRGAYCTFDVLMTSTNIGLIMGITVLIGILIALFLVVWTIRKLSGTPFMGTIEIEKYDANSYDFSQPVSMTPGRGSKRLESFGIGSCGLPKGCRIQAGGKKKEIYFISKQPVYADGAYGAVKKVTIVGNGTEVRICADAEQSHGIKIRFQSILNHEFGL
ncbi:MAG: VWA domain-containing protein [bacterium]|nr:VWA domain-containing protein [bacterium]